MKKYEIYISETEIIEKVKMKKSTYYDWKKRKPEMYNLVREALLTRKLHLKLQKDLLV